MGRFYQIIRDLSIDVAAGAMVGSLFVAGYLRVGLPITTVILLGLTVWVLYTMDHLIDARRVKHQASSSRHQFHQKYFKPIVIFWVLVVGVCAYLLLGLTLRTLSMGITLMVLAIIYFILLKSLPVFRGYLKELLSAFLYAAGVFLAPVALYQGAIGVQVFTFFLQFALIAFLNMLIFSSYEKESDKADGHGSLAMNLGEEWLKRLLLMVSALILVSGMHTGFLFQYDRPYLAVQLILFCMLATLSLIHLKPSFFGPQERYRIFGDLIFFYPLFLAA